jgi:ABC-type Zn2+ transport system substrate-binding protein/surface adhesin
MRGETQNQSLLLQTVASSHNYELEKASTSARLKQRCAVAYVTQGLSLRFCALG